MKKAALLGYPLKHSLSPILHKKLSKFIDEDVDYQFCEIKKEDFEKSIPELKKLCGFNITIPYKLKIAEYLDCLDISAQKHKSVNTVKNFNGKSVGFNTDCVGFERCLEGEEIPILGKVCIVGVGGAGRMFALECAERGCEIALALKKSSFENYNSGNLKDLEIFKNQISEISKKSVEVVSSDKICGKFDLLINASPVGMYPNVDEIPINSSALKNVKAVFDCIYNPKKTLLLKEAQNFGCKTCGGMAMLVWQAAAAQEIWFEKKFSNDDIQKVLREMEEIL